MMKHPYLNIFLRSLVLSASTIGGGFVILSAMRRIYIEKLKCLTEEEMLDIASLAQSCPGAVAVNASILVGHKLCGIPGAFLSVLGTILPPLLIMSLFAVVYRGADGNETIAKLMTGMQAGVAAVLLDTALVLTKKALADGFARIFVFVLALSAAVFTDISSAFIILGAGIAGILIYAMTRREA